MRSFNCIDKELNSSSRRVPVPVIEWWVQHNGIKQLHIDPWEDQSGRGSETDVIKILHDRFEVRPLEVRLSNHFIHNKHHRILWVERKHILLEEPPLPVRRRRVVIQIRKYLNTNQDIDNIEEARGKVDGRRQEHLFVHLSQSLHQHQTLSRVHQWWGLHQNIRHGQLRNCLSRQNNHQTLPSQRQPGILHQVHPQQRIPLCLLC